MFLIRLLYERKRKNMKKRNTLIIAILVAGMLVACENQQKDSTGSADSNITQDVKNEKTETETSETEIINPLAAIIDDYKNGNVEISGGKINAQRFQEISSEYSKYITDIGDYLEKHMNDIIDGKKLCDLDDYEDYFSGFYKWAGNLIYFDGKIAEDYKPVWRKFKEMLEHHVEVMNEIYAVDGGEATDSLNDLFQYLSDGSKDIASLVPAAKVHCGETITSENFAEMKLKSISYETRITPSDTSGVYSYYEVKNTDNIYLACNFDFKNLKTEAGTKLGDFLSFQVTYEGGYTYTGWTVAEDSNYLSQYPNLLPLSSYNSWCVMEVPKSLQNTPYTLTVTINGKEYQLEN